MDIASNEEAVFSQFKSQAIKMTANFYVETTSLVKVAFLSTNTPVHYSNKGILHPKWI